MKPKAANSAEVRQALTDLGVSYVAHNPRSTAGEVRNRGTCDELGELGRKHRIPFPVDHQRGVTMYESDEIVAYLEEQYS